MGFNEVVDYRHLQKEGLKCCLSGRWKMSIQAFEMTLSRATAVARQSLINRTFVPERTNDFYIYERGKTRLVRAHTVQDRQVYKSFCTYDLKPSMKSRIVDQNNASQIGKGTDRSIKQFRQDLAYCYKKFGRDFYVVIYDYHNYFGTLNHDIINDTMPVSDDGRWLLKLYTDVFEKQDGRTYGIGIGGEPSQDISVVYASKIHRMLCCDPHVVRAGWYMDDGYIMTRAKAEAKDAFFKVVAMSTKLGLPLNYKQSQIYHMTKDKVTWLKKDTRLSKTGKIIMTVTKKNIYSEIDRINDYKAMVDNGQMPQYSADMSIACWAGYTKPYMSNKARIKVINYYCDLFNIAPDRRRILFRRHQKGWITKSSLPVRVV